MRFKFKIVYFLLALKLNKFLFKHKLVALQKKRFKKLKRQLSKSKFYSKLIQSNSPLENYPIINKAIFMAEFNAINTVGITFKEANEVALQSESTRNFKPMIGKTSVGLSTGTSGNRGIFLASETERAKWVAAILDRVIGFKLKKRNIAFFLRANNNLYEAVNSNILQFNFFDILADFELNIKNLNALQPHILVAQPSMLIKIAGAQKDGFIKINPDKIISVAEVLTTEDRDYLSKIFGQVIHQVYQCTEGFLAATCKNGVLHFNEDFIKIEKKYLNEKMQKFHPIITDLMRNSQPVIRYELNDIITEKGVCTCGKTTMAIEQIEGRSDDVLNFTTVNKETKNIFPDNLSRAIIFSDETISDYTLIQKENDLVDLYIKSENENAFNNATVSLNKFLNSQNITNIRIHRLHSDPHIIGEKKRKIKNDCK